MFKNFKVKFSKETPWEVDFRDVLSLPNFTNKTVKLYILASACVLFFSFSIVAIFFELKLGRLKNKLSENLYQISSNEKMHKEVMEKNKRFRELSDLACSLVDACTYDVAPEQLFMSICREKPIYISLDKISILNMRETVPSTSSAAKKGGKSSNVPGNEVVITLSGFLDGSPNRLDSYRDSIKNIAEISKIKDKLRVSYDINKAEVSNANVKFNITYQN